MLEELDHGHVEKRSIQENTPDFQAQCGSGPPTAAELSRSIRGGGPRSGPACNAPHTRRCRPRHRHETASSLAGVCRSTVRCDFRKALRSTASNASRSPPASGVVACDAAARRSAPRSDGVPARKASWAGPPPRPSSPPGRKGRWPNRGTRPRPRSSGPPPAECSTRPLPYISNPDPVPALLAITNRPPTGELRRSICYNTSVNAWLLLGK